MKRLLILGGTGDAVKIAEKTEKLLNLKTIYSLAGLTNEPKSPKCETQTGGLGGANGLANYIQDTKVDFVIDATHPFAEKISANAAEVCNRINIPRIKFCRLAWAQNEIPWISVCNYSDTAEKLSSMGKRIFLSIGTKNLRAFSILVNKWFLIRTIDTPIRPIPLTNYSLVLGRGPFSKVQEQNLLTKFRIDVLVSKNSGGEPAAKLWAANNLGIPIVVIEQPLPPTGNTANTIEEILQWVSNKL